MICRRHRLSASIAAIVSSTGRRFALKRTASEKDKATGDGLVPMRHRTIDGLRDNVGPDNHHAEAHELYNNIVMNYADEFWTRPDGGDQDSNVRFLNLDGTSNERYDNNHWVRISAYSPANNGMLFSLHDRTGVGITTSVASSTFRMHRRTSSARRPTGRTPRRLGSVLRA